jgi:glutamate-1-semialdehyde 2,1-aminomutase
MTHLYKDTRTGSRELHQRAAKFMPGGDTRTVTYFEPYPSFMKSGSGCRILDVDGNEYIDFLNNYTSLVLGHAHPQVIAAVIGRVKKGSAFPAPIEEQIELAEIITGRVDSCDLVRFCNSGSEANIQTIRAAKKYTHRKKIVKVYGGYHGSFYFEDYIDIPFNDVEMAEKIIRENKNEIACVITEPILGKGMIPAKRDFLHLLRELTSEFDIVFILDEVVTFRLNTGGVQKIYDVTPDMTAFGKAIGGGFPVGAFGGRRDLMMQFSPQEEEFLHHSGTFNGNPVTMTAGIETLKILDSTAIRKLNEMGDQLRNKLNTDLENACVSGMGSLLHFHPGRNPAVDAAVVEKQNKTWISQLHMAMLMKGIYMGPKGMFNVSLAMGKEEIQMFSSVAGEVFKALE